MSVVDRRGALIIATTTKQTLARITGNRNRVTLSSFVIYVMACRMYLGGRTVHQGR